jgi:hypothetical protein
MNSKTGLKTKGNGYDKDIDNAPKKRPKDTSLLFVTRVVT